jgi:hypothetical protein
MTDHTTGFRQEANQESRAFLLQANQEGRLTVAKPDELLSPQGAALTTGEKAVVVLAPPAPQQSRKHRRAQHRPLNSPGQVGFEGGEHTAIGDNVYLHFSPGDPGGIAWQQDNWLTTPNTLRLSYGQIVALGGDFYGLPDQPISDGSSVEDQRDRFLRAFNSLATLPASLEEARKILHVMDTEIQAVNAALFDGTSIAKVYAELGDSLSVQWNMITGGGGGSTWWLNPGRYLKLAKTNWDHFGQRAVLAYKAGHAVALKQAISAGRAEQSQRRKQLEVAYAMNAFADHYLSDLFSSGHLRTPRKELYESTTLGETGSYLSKYMHDEDCLYGLNVSNSRSESWKAYGDKRYFDTVDNENKWRVDEAVQISTDEIFQAFLIGTAPEPDSYTALLCLPNLKEVQDYVNNLRGNTSPLFIVDEKGVWPRVDYNDLEKHKWPHTYWTGPTLLEDFWGWNPLYPKYNPPYPLPGHVSAPKSAPSIASWNSNVPIQPDWVEGNSVRYAVSYVQRLEESDLGPWSSWTTLSNSSFEPNLREVPIDPQGIATARRVYRQFALVNGKRTFTVPVGSIPDNTTTIFADTLQTTQIWQHIPGTLTSVSVGRDGSVWGVNAQGTIFQYMGSGGGWHQIEGKLSQISVGDTSNVWGVNAQGTIFKYVGGTEIWHPIEGTLTQVSAASDGTVWGVNAQGTIFNYLGEKQGWEWIEGKLSQVSVGNASNVWGVNAQGTIFVYLGSGQGWLPIEGTLACVSIASDGTVWGTQAQGNIYRFTGGPQVWANIPGNLCQISVGNALDVWGVDAQGTIFRYMPSTDLSAPVPNQKFF